MRRPRTVDGATRYSLSQARAHARREKERAQEMELEKEQEQEREQEQEKRKRGRERERERESRGEGSGEAPPRKKTRVEQPAAGPSRRKEPEVVEAPDEGLRDDEQEQEQVAVEGEAHNEEGGQGGEEQDEEGQDEEGDEEDDDEDEEDRGPIGSDDYHGEIFDEPEPEAEVEGQDGSESESDREQEEAELMLSDNPFAGAQDIDETLGDNAHADADVDMVGDETVVEAGYVVSGVTLLGRYMRHAHPPLHFQRRRASSPGRKRRGEPIR